MGIEPTPTAWKAVVLAVILHPHVEFRISHKILPYGHWNVKDYFKKDAGRRRLFGTFASRIVH